MSAAEQGYRKTLNDAFAAIDELPVGDPRIDEILYNLPPVPRPAPGPAASAHIKALDLFAGTGWGVACQRLGIKEAGVEIMPEAVATRTANGMDTIYHDVWDGLQLTAEQHRNAYGSYGLLIASPPCQTFSLAGKGAGRAALDEVLEAIELHAYKDADALLAFGTQHDMRTALVLSPLAYVWRDRPRLVAFEQVPTVLPVWEACAEVMRDWGYEVKVEVLNAEQYGVPQTRKRAILVARRNGPVSLPAPTHSKYYSRTPGKLDPGVRKWVSMAEALGWRGMTTRPSPTITGGGTDAGGAEPIAKYHERYTSAPGWTGSTDRLSTEEAATLQSYPAAVVRTSMGKPKEDERNGSHELDPFNRPAHTLTSKSESWLIKQHPGFIAASGTSCQVVDPRPANHPAPTITGAGNAEFGERPTRAIGPGDRDPEGRRLTAGEASTLQSYAPPFVWCGTKTKQFLQIGNAVPPLLAEHILAALVGIPTSEVAA